MKKHLLTLILALCMVGITWAQPALIPGSTTVYWEIKNDTALHITGTGAMPNFVNPDYQPWAASRTAITQLSIADGITAIGGYAFYNCGKLSGALVIPDKINSIGECAFSGCSKLTFLTLSANLIYIGKHAFSDCSSLTQITPMNQSAVQQMD